MLGLVCTHVCGGVCVWVVTLISPRPLQWLELAPAGRDAIHAWAASAATLYARGLKRLSGDSIFMLLDPSNTSLLVGLVVVPTVVEATQLVLPIQVVNGN